MLKLVMKHPFIFDYMKYETLRAEINYGVRRKKSQILWDDKFQIPEIYKLGALSGVLCELVNLGSIKRGLPRDANGKPTGHEENEWCLQPEFVYLPGRFTDDDVDLMKGMCEKQQTPVSRSSFIIPGISVVYLDELEAMNHFREEYNGK